MLQPGQTSVKVLNLPLNWSRSWDSNPDLSLTKTPFYLLALQRLWSQWSGIKPSLRGYNALVLSLHHTDSRLYWSEESGLEPDLGRPQLPVLPLTLLSDDESQPLGKDGNYLAILL